MLVRHGTDTAGLGKTRTDWNKHLLMDVIAPSYCKFLHSPSRCTPPVFPSRQRPQACHAKYFDARPATVGRTNRFRPQSRRWPKTRWQWRVLFTGCKWVVSFNTSFAAHATFHFFLLLLPIVSTSLLRSVAYWRRIRYLRVCENSYQLSCFPCRSPSLLAHYLDYV